jgi:hypothetical protein
MNILSVIAASRRRVTTDPDALDYFSRAEALGGSFDQTAINALYTEAYIKSAISDCIAGLKTDAVWSKITELYLHAGVTFPGLMAKVKHAGTATLTNNGPYVAGDYLAAGVGAGLKSASLKWLGTSFLDAISYNGSISCYVKNAPANQHPIGLLNVSLVKSIRPNGSPGWFYWKQGPDQVSFGSSHSSGYFIGSARAINDLQAYRNGVSTGFTTNAPDSVATGYEFVLSRAGAINYQGEMIAAHIGTGLTTTNAQNLSSRINTLMTALGCNVY